MHPLIEWTAAALIVIAAFFLLVGAIGLARLPDFFMRLHAPTKASTLGVGGVLLASMLVGAVTLSANTALAPAPVVPVMTLRHALALVL